MVKKPCLLYLIYEGERRGVHFFTLIAKLKTFLTEFTRLGYNVTMLQCTRYVILFLFCILEPNCISYESIDSNGLVM